MDSQPQLHKIQTKVQTQQQEEQRLLLSIMKHSHQLVNNLSRSQAQTHSLALHDIVENYKAETQSIVPTAQLQSLKNEFDQGLAQINNEKLRLSQQLLSQLQQKSSLMESMNSCLERLSRLQERVKLKKQKNLVK